MRGLGDRNIHPTFLLEFVRLCSFWFHFPRCCCWNLACRKWKANRERQRDNINITLSLVLDRSKTIKSIQRYSKANLATQNLKTLFLFRSTWPNRAAASNTAMTCGILWLFVNVRQIGPGEKYGQLSSRSMGPSMNINEHAVALRCNV